MYILAKAISLMCRSLFNSADGNVINKMYFLPFSYPPLVCFVFTDFYFEDAFFL